MKRSQINAAIDNAHAALAQHGIRLPHYGYWSPDQWRQAGPEYDRVKLNMLGWAVTDFGQDDFDNIGITMFDVRNGTPERPEEGTPYGEKIFILKAGQRLPFHFHWKKKEDIISYAGGTLMLQVYASNEDETMNEEKPGEVYLDGVRHEFTAGQTFEIPHGCSLTITQKLYHRFWAKEGAGTLIGGEISTISIPKTDNRFGGNARRFVPIDEDEAPRWLLNIDYAKLQ